MNTKHTPGPWKASKPYGLAHWNISVGQLCLANVPNFIGSAVTMEHDGEGESNARLIASAPELLAALKNAGNVLAGLATGDLKEIRADSPALAQIRAAIAKAEGTP